VRGRAKTSSFEKKWLLAYFQKKKPRSVYLARVYSKQTKSYIVPYSQTKVDPEWISGTEIPADVQDALNDLTAEQDYFKRPGSGPVIARSGVDKAASSDKRNAKKQRGQSEPGGFTCDECAQPILGIRFSCDECSDYDLCSSCRALSAHPQHAMSCMACPNRAVLMALEHVPVFFR
jgi:hypothetical protein